MPSYISFFLGFSYFLPNTAKHNQCFTVGDFGSSAAIIVKPATLLKLHRALINSKHRKLFSNRTYKYQTPSADLGIRTPQAFQAKIKLSHRVNK